MGSRQRQANMHGTPDLLLCSLADQLTTTSFPQPGSQRSFNSPQGALSFVLLRFFSAPKAKPANIFPICLQIHIRTYVLANWKTLGPKITGRRASRRSPHGPAQRARQVRSPVSQTPPTPISANLHLPLYPPPPVPSPYHIGKCVNSHTSSSVYDGDTNLRVYQVHKVQSRTAGFRRRRGMKVEKSTLKPVSLSTAAEVHY